VVILQRSARNAFPHAESKAPTTRRGHHELVEEFSHSDSRWHTSSNKMHGENSLTRFYLLGCYRGPSTTRADSLRPQRRFFTMLCNYCTGWSWVESWLTAVTS